MNKLRDEKSKDWLTNKSITISGHRPGEKIEPKSQTVVFTNQTNIFDKTGKIEFCDSVSRSNEQTENVFSKLTNTNLISSTISEV